MLIFLKTVSVACDAKTATELEVTPFRSKVTLEKLIFYIVALLQ